MEEKRKEFLPMYGGIWGGMVPLAILIVGLAVCCGTRRDKTFLGMRLACACRRFVFCKR